MDKHYKHIVDDTNGKSSEELRTDILKEIDEAIAATSDEELAEYFMIRKVDYSMKKVILIRAVSGAGKSTFAEMLAPDSCICCADDFFTDEQGNYNFDASKLGQAHKACRDKYLKLVDHPYVDLIVVSNTNTKESDYKFYLDEAEKRGIMVFSLVLENRHGGKNIHGLPDHVLERQEQNIKNSLKLR
jgi:hypothetical protein